PSSSPFDVSPSLRLPSLLFFSTAASAVSLMCLLSILAESLVLVPASLTSSRIPTLPINFFLFVDVMMMVGVISYRHFLSLLSRLCYTLEVPCQFRGPKVYSVRLEVPTSLEVPNILEVP
ncbi:hypothetical protein PMAYCL1PPCAC_18344, partial [Pristionchus mayeri]